VSRQRPIEKSRFRPHSPVSAPTGRTFAPILSAIEVLAAANLHQFFFQFS
jgi:hypothetical protein